MLYEAVLLFGPVVAAGGLYSVLLNQRHALYMRHGMLVLQLCVIGLYFVWFWSHGGQTLPMKTWRIRVVGPGNTPPSVRRSTARYALSWFWFLPGVALAWAVSAKGWMLVLIPALNMLLWALAVYLDPQRQFLHDRLAGTRLIKVAP
jgi:uncharacterized RDD family membrane protein YckC